MPDAPNNPSLAALYPQLVDHVPCAIVALDETGRVVLFNRAAEQLTGYDAAEMLGSTCEALQTRLRGPADGDVLRFVCPFARDRHDEEECELTRKDGSTVIVVRRGGPLFDPAGRRIGGVQAMMDVTAIKAVNAELATLREQVARLGRFGELIGSSAAMRRVYEVIDMVADTTACVVIHGPTGAGKELVARTIHARGPRRDGPFLAVNCGALPDNLLEAELFGHVAGAFTGAIGDRKGRFEEADGGTLLLDEVGELSPHAQTKLLRVIQSGEIVRVGESVPRHVDVRIVAATHRDLKAMVADGTFREDLYYRLQVVRIDVPALRDRADDIPELVAAFVERLNAKYGRHIQRCDATAMRILESCAWPGNVRQLEHAIEHAFVVSGPTAETISLQSLPADLLGEMPATPPPAPVENDDAQREAIRSALANSAGNKAQAARTLGLSRAGLYKRMRRLGL